MTASVYKLLHAQTKYPLHLGITEAGTEYNGIIKSAIGIGSLLLEGIGDTIRVSLTAPPEDEIKAAKAILKALGLRSGIDVISCPTCGRCDIDLISITGEVEARLRKLDREPDLTIAVMGCVVNGPGEASQADYGISGTGISSAGIAGAAKPEGVIFAKGKIVKKVPMNELIDELFKVMEI